MKVKNFKWLLNELCNRKGKLNILDVFFCVSDRVKSKYYYNTPAGIKSGIIEDPLKTKHFLLDLLDKLSPKMQEFAPEKVICLLHLNSAIKVLTTSDIIQMSSAKLRTISIKSVHIVPEEGCSGIYRINYDLKIQSIRKIYVKASKKALQGVQIGKKAYELVDLMGELVYKFTGKDLESMICDFMLDDDMNCHLIKVLEVSVSEFHRKLKTNHAENIDAPNSDNSNNLRSSSNKFIEMLAKTIDKERRSEIRGHIEPIFDESKCIDTIQDLIEEVETTRPRLWTKDFSRRKKTYMRLLPKRMTIKKKIETKKSVYNFKSPVQRSKIQVFIADAESRKEKKVFCNTSRSRYVSPMLRNLERSYYY